MSVDILILEKDGIVLIKRGRAPSKGMWGLPGGYIEYGEEPHLAAVREAKEETGLDIILENNKRAPAVFGEGDRNPKWHIITLAFRAKAKNIKKLRAGDDADDARIFKKEEIPEKMAFDHRKIIKEVLGW